MNNNKKTTKKRKIAFKSLTLEQQRKLFLKSCRTKKEFHKFIKQFFGLHLPDQTVSRFADTNPLDCIWDIYDIVVNKNNPHDIQELLYVAGRGSGKCVVKGTHILSDGIKCIEDIKVGDRVYTGWGWHTVKQWFNEGVKPGVCISTRNGKYRTPYTLTGSLKHRIQVVDENGNIDWAFLKDLKKDQLVYKSSECSFDVDTNSQDYTDGWLVGAITGDGAVNRHNSNNITFCSSDFESLRFYANQVYNKFQIKQTVKRNSKYSVNLSVSNASFKQWYSSYIDGHLCYDKKLKTLEHSPNFLSGFIAGLMDTDGSMDSIALANKELIGQIGKILNIFGISCTINDSRRKPRYSEFINKYVSYSEVRYKTKLHDFLMPMFSKRDKFITHRNKQNEQFRFPNKILQPFAHFIKEELKASNGWITDGGNRIRKAVPYAKELFGQLNCDNNYIYGYKIEAIREFFIDLGCTSQVEKLNFILNGYFETIDTVEYGNYEFYDIEMNMIHSYWSNGFISHNTLGMAIVELMVLLHDQREVVHVGAVLAQADRCYLYIKNFLYNRRLKDIVSPAKVHEDDRILKAANMGKSVFNVGGLQPTLEILPCTLKATNGPHVPLVVVDEIDTVSGEGLKAFKEISGMLDSKGGKRALRVGISTRKSRYGLMNKQIEDAEIHGTVVKRWTAFEFSERCPDSRSGINPITGYTIIEDMEMISEEEFKIKDAKKKKEYSRVTLPGEKCLRCPAASICLGDAKNQQSKSWMLKPIDEIIKKVRKEGVDWALSQLMNLKPSVEGIIFKEFDERVHVCDWNKMWRRLTGRDFPGECTHDIFVKKCHQLKIPCYGGIDWGWRAPSTVTYAFVDKKDNVYVVRAEGMTYISNPEWIHHIKHKYNNMYRPQLYFPDQADQGAIVEMRKAGLPAHNDAKKNDVSTGIQVIKKLLRVPGTTDTKILFADETCKALIAEFGLYHYKTSADGTISDMIDTEHDHWLDALRYTLEYLLGKTQFMMAGGHTDSSEVADDGGNFYKTPTPEEFAKVNGIGINVEEEDISKLGKIGKISDLESDDDDEFEGGGGFLWSL